MADSFTLPSSVMIFGCGYVGTALARRLLDAGVRVSALTRNAEQAAELACLGLSEVIVSDLDSLDWHEQVKLGYEAVVNCVSSAGGGLEGYRKSYLNGQRSIIQWAGSQQLRRYVYTSSTSVYPQDGGVWVDESSDTSGAPATGQVLLESEALLAESKIAEVWSVLRLAGIYGPGRHYLLDQLRAGEGEIPGSGDYALNMIHLDDICSVILSALGGGAAPGVYNVTDDCPSTKADVLQYLAERLHRPAPIFNPDLVSPRLKRRGGRMPDRKIANAKAKSAFSWSPQYPSFREGYADWVS